MNSTEAKQNIDILHEHCTSSDMVYVHRSGAMGQVFRYSHTFGNKMCRTSCEPAGGNETVVVQRSIWDYLSCSQFLVQNQV